MPTNLPASALGALGSSPTPPPAERVVFNLPPAANFVFLCSPTEWLVMKTAAGYEVLPCLERLHYYPGQKGVRQVQDASGRWVGEPSMAIARKQARGKIAIPTDWPVSCYDRSGQLIAERSGYVHQVPGRGGAVHLDVWTRPYRMGDSVFTERDTVGYHAFLRAVRDQLLNGGPNPEVKSALRARLAELVRIGGPRKAEHPDTLTIKAKIAALDAPAAPVKTRRKRSTNGTP